jgi:hypothetical protein
VPPITKIVSSAAIAFSSFLIAEWGMKRASTFLITAGRKNIMIKGAKESKAKPAATGAK